MTQLSQVFGLRRARTLVQVVTPLGWAVICCSVVGLGIFLFTHWQEFAIASAALLGAVAVAAPFAAGRAAYRVTLNLNAHRVVVGQRATGELVVTTKARSRMLPAQLELPVGTGVASFAIPSLGVGDSHEELFAVPTHRRAVIPVGPARSVRGDAVGLIRRVIVWTEPEAIYVHPRTVPLEGAAPGHFKDLEGQATRQLSNDDVSFHALREYRAGDDRRYIHWRSSARTGQLMVRQFEETRRSHLAVGLSTALGDYADEEEFEIAVSAAASLGVQAFRDERELTVFDSRGVISTVTARQMLDGFSAVTLSQTDGGTISLAQHISATSTNLSIAFLLCGSTPKPADIRSAAMAFPLGVRVLVIRTVTGAAMAFNSIAAVPILTVGVLDELPRALRQAVRSV